jgi:glutamate-5-semialdehyde dehydrogenase
MDFASELDRIGRQARKAARQLSVMTTEQKNACLHAIADEILAQSDAICAANAIDLENGRVNNLTSALMDRLALDPGRVADVAQALRDMAELPDPVGKVDREFTLPNGLAMEKVRVPIGVIGIIYESRPNVTADAGGLCLKAGNAVILRGGSEALHSNRAIAEAMAAGGARAGLPDHAVQLLPWADRAAVAELLKLTDHLDLLIPRGGEGLIRYVSQNATVPVIKHYKGVCHVYVDKAADPAMALDIIENGKCQRPGVCNAVETVLIHRDIADTFAGAMAERLAAEGVELRGDAAFRALVPDAAEATEDDWHAEYLELILAVRVVDDVDAAIDHIADYGSSHSDAVVTGDQTVADAFVRGVDSAAVYVNASTRFTDGGQFGMGAEIGISTDRIHARGPMGLEELTTYKYVARGTGQIR